MENFFYLSFFQKMLFLIKNPASFHDKFEYPLQNTSYDQKFKIPVFFSKSAYKNNSNCLISCKKTVVCCNLTMWQFPQLFYCVTLIYQQVLKVSVVSNINYQDRKLFFSHDIQNNWNQYEHFLFHFLLYLIYKASL